MAAPIDAAMLWGMLSQPPPARTSRPSNTPWGAVSLLLGILTLACTLGTFVVWFAGSGTVPVMVSMSTVVVFGMAAVVTGVRGHRIGPGGASGDGLALAGILTGALGIAATAGWIVLSIALAILAGLFVVLALSLWG